MEISERLKKAIQSKNKTLKSFSNEAGIPYITLQQYLAGKRKPGTDALLKINIYLNVSIDWLLTGQGEMYREKTIQSDLKLTLNWLNEWWEQADDQHRNWLEVQMKRCFPEYAEWLLQHEKSLNEESNS